MSDIDLLNVNNLINSGNLYSEYQPLVTTHNSSIFAYEALMRTIPRVNPLTVIEHARNNGLLFELDTNCIINALKGYPKNYIKNHYLFVNIFPSTLVHERFETFIQDIHRQIPTIRNRVVFEINESELEGDIWRERLFLKRLGLLKSLGFGIAFDDLSISKTSLKKMEILTPDYVKLDHTRSKNLSSSIVQQQLISLFLEYTNEKMKLVLEGIEEKEDLLVAKQLGVPLIQGYYISKPHRLS